MLDKEALDEIENAEYAAGIAADLMRDGIPEKEAGERARRIVMKEPPLGEVSFRDGLVKFEGEAPMSYEQACAFLKIRMAK